MPPDPILGTEAVIYYRLRCLGRSTCAQFTSYWHACNVSAPWAGAMFRTKALRT